MIRTVGLAQQRHPFGPCEIGKLRGGDIPHRTSWSAGPVPDTDQQQTTRTQQTREPHEGPMSFGWVNMHPHPAQENEVEPPVQRVCFGQFRQPVIEPAHARSRMERSGRTTEFSRRLHRHNLEASSIQPSGVPARSGSDVQRRTSGRKEVEDRRMDQFGRQRFVPGSELSCIGVIPVHRVFHSMSSLPACSLHGGQARAIRTPRFGGMSAHGRSPGSSSAPRPDALAEHCAGGRPAQG